MAEELAGGMWGPVRIVTRSCVVKLSLWREECKIWYKIP